MFDPLDMQPWVFLVQDMLGFTTWGTAEGAGGEM
jgi:hypothetical protein